MSIWKRFLNQYKKNARYRTRIVRDRPIEDEFVDEELTMKEKLYLLGAMKAGTEYTDEESEE